MRIIASLWLIAFLLAAPMEDAAAQSAQAKREAAFDAGVTAYDQGDYARAFELWKPLADDLDLAAMRNVAQLYRRGLGVKQDYRKARRYYKRAAEYGLSSAQVNLGLMYLEGEGVKPDAQEAAEWFYEAARGGDANGQFYLAQQLQSGIGVGQDIEAARSYYAAAARQGHRDAAAALDLLGGPPPPKAPDIHLSSEKLAENDKAASNLPRKDPRRLYGGTGLLRGTGRENEVER